VSESASLGDLLAQLSDFTLGRINVCLPGTIVSYNPATQTATVQPVPAARYHDPETDALVPEAMPQIANVPVRFPVGLGGTIAITWPLAPGDPVTLEICDRSLDEWKSTGAPATVPQDVRRFDLTDAIAVPGPRPPSQPIQASGHHPSALVLQAPMTLVGSSAAADPPVTESRLQLFLTELLFWLGTHTHSGVTTGPGVSAVPVQAVDLPTPGPLGALKVRVE
jgi:hypothetical protein